MLNDPDVDSVRSVIYDWRDAIEEKQKIDQSFLKEILLALVEGMLSLDNRVSSLSSQEWRGAREIIALQDEMNEQRYKMILLQKGLQANHSDTIPSNKLSVESAS